MASTTFTFTILTGVDSVPGSIRNWVQSNAIPSAQILEEAQAWIYTRIRAREMRFSKRITIPEGAYVLALPDLFLDPIGLRMDGDTADMDYVQENLLGRLTDDANQTVDTGRPERWTLYDEKMQFDVAADDDYNGVLTYYASLPLLSADAPTNFLTDRFPSLLRHACTALGYSHRKRWDDAKTEFQLAEVAVNDVNVAADMSRRGQIMR